MNRRAFLSLAPLILVPEPRRAYSFVGGWQESKYPLLASWGDLLRVMRMPGETDDGVRRRMLDKLSAAHQLSTDRLLFGFSAHYEDTYGNIVRVKPTTLKRGQVSWMPS